MSYLKVAGATKRYGNFTALSEVSIAVEKGEFFTLLRPSGCGKTTLLRAIAGFNDITSGSIVLDGANLRVVPPHRRDIGMVFQDYAIFPHLSVFDNVAFGLRPRKVPGAEIRSRVAQALGTVRLEAMADRLPAAMSGGQQQRIGLARAMVINPRLLLMDEPLSNLDAKLRIELREEIRDIQRQVNITTIYVTHDQEEALAISDRICVMSAGRVEQIGTPQEIYGDPQSLFVASFVGTLNRLAPEAATRTLLAGLGVSAPADATIAIRPENLSLSGEGLGGEVLEGKVRKFTYLGREAHLLVTTPAGDLVVQLSNPSRREILAPGTAIGVTVRPEGIMVFDTLGRRIGAGG
jgi:iron(III) transport system ATP-binding protein